MPEFKYYPVSPNADTTCDADTPHDMDRVQPGMAAITSRAHSSGTFEEVLTFDLDLGTDLAQMFDPSFINVRLDVSSFGGSGSEARFRVQLVNDTGCGIVASTPYSDLFTTIGVKTLYGARLPMAGGNRLRLSIETRRTVVGVQDVTVSIGASTWVIVDTGLGTHAIADSVISALKGINGAIGGFWHDVGGRVYNRLIPPEDNRITEYPYLCVVTSDERPTYEEPEGGQHLIHSFELQIFGFVRDETGVDSYNTAAQADLYKLHDDVLKVWFNDHTWGGTVDDSFPTAGPRHAGVLSGYGEFLLSMRVRSYLSLARLGFTP